MFVRYKDPSWDPEGREFPLEVRWEALSSQADDLPVNFGTVDDKLYRSGAVFPHQVPALQEEHGVSHIISLVQGFQLTQFYEDPSITIHQFPGYSRKEWTFERVKKVVGTINELEGKCLVHCTRGVLKSGKVVAGYRILNGQKGRIGAIWESASYGMLNPSSIREMASYRK